jgi:acetoacetate decarboxylase
MRSAGGSVSSTGETMGFVKSQEELDRYFALGVRRFVGARMLGVIFETHAAIVERLLPPPLEPPVAPGGLMFIAEYPTTNLGPGYKEAALFVRCTYKGDPGAYCLAMPIESEESRLYNGRDIFGFPKKMAKIHLEKDGPAVSGWVERHGIRFVEIKASMTGTLPGLPPQGPTYLFKASPRIDLQPGFDGPVFLCRQQTDIKMKSLEIGTAEVIYRPSEYDPWAEVEITNVVAAFFLISDNTMQPGTVLGEVDRDAYLPYYFKITDFFAG